MTAAVIQFPHPELPELLASARETALNGNAPDNARRDACAVLNAYGDWRDHLTAREIMARLNAIQGGDITPVGQHIARQVQDFRHLTPEERRSIGIEHDDEVQVWGVSDNFTALNAKAIRRDRALSARPYVMAAFVAAGVLAGLAMAYAAQAAALGAM